MGLTESDSGVLPASSVSDVNRFSLNPLQNASSSTHYCISPLTRGVPFLPTPGRDMLRIRILMGMQILA